MVLAAGLVEAERRHIQHRDALDNVRLAALRIPLQRALHLREERVGEVRPQRLDVLRRPAVLHLHVEIRRLFAQRRRVEGRIDLRIFADGRERSAVGAALGTLGALGGRFLRRTVVFHFRPHRIHDRHHYDQSHYKELRRVGVAGYISVIIVVTASGAAARG